MLKRTLNAIATAIAFLGNLWWAGVVLMITGEDITERKPDERANRS